jgi:Tfp pilus assembly protein PilX
MLMLVLVALVAMMISGVALVRSMDTSQLVAGNLASRNSTLHSADLGVQQAVTWIQSQASTGALNTDAPANGYYAAAVEEPWTSASFWTTCTSCTTASDGAGNNVSWVINRVCKVAGSPNAAGNFCSSLNGSASNGGSYSSDAVNFTGSPKYYYRITVQVVDRRNSASLSQAFVTL